MSTSPDESLYLYLPSLFREKVQPGWVSLQRTMSGFGLSLSVPEAADTGVQENNAEEMIAEQTTPAYESLCASRHHARFRSRRILRDPQGAGVTVRVTVASLLVVLLGAAPVSSTALSVNV
jgi:hypothetical protein